MQNFDYFIFIGNYRIIAIILPYFLQRFIVEREKVTPAVGIKFTFEKKVF